AMGLDYADTWTCYRGGELACGHCGSCRERLAAFAANGVEDPLSYLQRPDTADKSQRPNAAAGAQQTGPDAGGA
ncbi:MAG TPA: 7-cyano-7-deazaguanine synthase, partial [Halomonas sp.]|nr:7-cyano-7-deazaguanine synthase [Halomonas sp.]